MSELVYTFDGPEDARVYLREVSTVSVVWVIGLAGLLITQALLLIAWAVVVFVALFLAARPLQRRAEELVPDNTVEAGRVNTVLRGGTTRDRVLRDLFYGTKPLRTALAECGMSQRWIVLRHLVVALTILAMAYVVFGPRP